jgi:uncharacterized membrane protein YjjB (DUF3815 family)
MLNQILLDALYSAIAAIGFAAISRPPKRAYKYCALIAAIGHASRYVLMLDCGPHFHIVAASTIAAFIIGTLAVLLTTFSKTPAETCLFPALLPMIPGIYAYKTVGGLVMCLASTSAGAEKFNYYFFQFASNGITTLFIILGMVIGATLPIFMFKKISFQATRSA